ncbi:Signal peptidase-like protein [Adhaeribacter swui]|uniref:Signal peptidase-like protein n=1 Tax=Adhaeribacter swui TaxID=2086471 RepID=A0A7G7G561_9BACT|nr:regulatory iron-sulfur-containing complex subunit RicT [Adhaeribacter swui]QNF32295.1 Signal peptidase-like protein [Adhaeribacter swui]
MFDWLSDMDLPTSFEEFDIVEVRFKGGRKDFYRNVNSLPLITGDAVVVDVPNGHHIGYVSLKGELVRLQMLKKKVDNNEEIRSIYRIATEKDLEKLQAVQDLESNTMYRARTIIQECKLKMKLSDVEYQADRSKATFYYSAEDRVDFRDLIKKLADEFKIRVEMRQISLRHEAGRLGGIGSCGRELCCSTWLTDFKSVSTTAARYQNLSLNPSKLSGQCGRLKCCLNYELETYMDALKDIPNVTRPLLIQRGEAILQKTDIFKRLMWFGFRDDNNWYPVSVERVKEILDLNAQGKPAETLVPIVENPKKEISLVAQLEGNLERLDEKFTKPKKKKKKKKNPENKENKGDQAAVSQHAKTPEVVNDAAIPGQGQRPKNKFKNKKNKPRPVTAEAGNNAVLAGAAPNNRPERERVKHENNAEGQPRNRDKRPHHRPKGPRPDKPASV